MTGEKQKRPQIAAFIRVKAFPVKVSIKI